MSSDTEERCQFWNDIWGKEVFHNESSYWLKEPEEDLANVDKQHNQTSRSQKKPWRKSRPHKQLTGKAPEFFFLLRTDRRPAKRVSSIAIGPRMSDEEKNGTHNQRPRPGGTKFQAYNKHSVDVETLHSDIGRGTLRPSREKEPVTRRTEGLPAKLTGYQGPVTY